MYTQLYIIAIVVQRACWHVEFSLFHYVRPFLITDAALGDFSAIPFEGRELTSGITSVKRT